jgi:hypothetical protein
MSLWSKSVESITFDDVNNFLLLKEREGPRLDYKADVPKDFYRSAAAFANTNGGMFILGVDADKATNEPKWPRSAGDPGMKSAKGIEERIHQICRDNIFPPIRPQTSPPIPIPSDPDNVLVVVRIDMSPEAPHSSDGGRRIYERSGSVTEPINFAHIDRIQHLLDHRRRLDEARESSIQLAIDRSVRQLLGRKLWYINKEQPDRTSGANVGLPIFVPLRWVSVIPYYPWSELCSPAECYKFHPHLPNAGTVQRVPGGTFARAYVQDEGGAPRGCSMLTTKGHVFTIEWAKEAEANFLKEHRKDPTRLTRQSLLLSLWDVANWLKRGLQAASDFYKGMVDSPGQLLVTLGIRDARYFRMERQQMEGDIGRDFRHIGEPFVDDHFRADQMATPDELSERSELTYDLLDQLADGFDLLRLPRGIQW